jgi:hypothetical protein
MAKALSRCPVCEGSLQISELHCAGCGTSIHGSFESCRFCRLAPEHLSFIETYLRCEGNLSKVEKELNLSYPTVRNRLSAAVAALGFAPEVAPAPPPAAQPPIRKDLAQQRVQLLERLSQGEISAEEAAAKLRELS